MTKSMLGLLLYDSFGYVFVESLLSGVHDVIEFNNGKGVLRYVE